MRPHALTGAAVFDGHSLIDGHVVLLGNNVPAVLPPADLPANCPVTRLDGGVLMPGFVDLQINGGGGVMLNGAPTAETIRTIAKAHRGLGTRHLLPTLITDRPEITRAAISAVHSAIDNGEPGIAGLHLEGPHLDPRRKGAHDAALIRPMTASDMALLIEAAQELPNLMVTLAPESVTVAQVRQLADAGVILSLGHSDCDYDTACRYIEAGAVCVTHLFNAMSQLGSRTPGLAGAALDCGAVSAGMIADGIHVHPATMRSALRAKQGAGDIFLVTDAMACAGTGLSQFELNGRQISRSEGRLTLPDGTLAGADLSMARAIEVLVNQVGEPLETALKRATSIPAALLRNPGSAGRWPDMPEDLIYLSPDFEVTPATRLAAQAVSPATSW